MKTYSIGAAIVAASATLSYAQPAPPRAEDITNQSLSFSAMVDVGGNPINRQWFALTRTCTVRVYPAKGTGFTVRWRIKTANGTDLAGSIVGNQAPREVRLPPGQYQFVIEARKKAGYYTYPVETNCS
jgi:hypothetical protein